MKFPFRPKKTSPTVDDRAGPIGEPTRHGAIPSLIFLVFVIAIGATGYSTFQHQKQSIRQGSQDMLSAIADAKVSQIGDWLQQRYSHGATVARDATLAAEAERFFRGGAGKDAARRNLSGVLAALREHYHYRSVTLLDAQADGRLSAGDPDELSALERERAREAMRTGLVVLSDLHQEPAGGQGGPELDATAPLAVRTGTGAARIVGAIHFRTDPYQHLYPLVQSWPTPSPSAETLLVRLDGDRVLFLNELRHQKGTALQLRAPMSQEQLALPAIMAGRGLEGVFEGNDYRGVPVLAAVREVPGASWYMISKVDVGEIYGGIRTTGQMVAALVSIFILGAALALGIWYRWEHHLFAVREQKSRLVEKVRSGKALLKSQQRFRVTFEQAPVGIAHTSLHGTLILVNRTLCDLLGYGQEELAGRAIAELLHPQHRSESEETVQTLLKGAEDKVIRQQLMLRADKTTVWVSNTVSLVRDEAGNPEYFVGVVEDITARLEYEQRLAYLASHDVLTGLPNRALLLDRLGQALSHAARHRRVVAVVFLDLDRFKFVNDSFGHGTGDQLLKAVALRLSSCVRTGDTTARLGGDEFAFVLDDMAHAHDVAPIMQKILNQFTQPFRIEGSETGTLEFHFTASIGISCYPGDGEDAHILLRNADAAMYLAKEKDGDGYQFFTQDMNARAHRRMNLESALHRAFEQEQFVLHYQPQVDRLTGKIISTEALLRWNHPEQGLISPAEFIPLLEETGLIVPVGEWVLRTACLQQRAWRVSGLSQLHAAVNVGVAVNLSIRQLRDENFVDNVVKILADTGMEPGCLELEITESMVMQRIAETTETLRALNALGVSLALDDFGVGYSSLNHLKRLPLGTLKIDKSFIRDITSDEDDAIIVSATIAMAQGLHLKVVAEGVETREQFDFLRTCGCDAMQGYFFSRPLPAEEISRLLQNDGNVIRS